MKLVFLPIPEMIYQIGFPISEVKKRHLLKNLSLNKMINQYLPMIVNYRIGYPRMQKLKRPAMFHRMRMIWLVMLPVILVKKQFPFRIIFHPMKINRPSGLKMLNCQIGFPKRLKKRPKALHQLPKVICLNGFRAWKALKLRQWMTKLQVQVLKMLHCPIGWLI